MHRSKIELNIEIGPQYRVPFKRNAIVRITADNTILGEDNITLMKKISNSPKRYYYFYQLADVDIHCIIYFKLLQRKTKDLAT